MSVLKTVHSLQNCRSCRFYGDFVKWSVRWFTVAEAATTLDYADSGFNAEIRCLAGFAPTIIVAYSSLFCG